MAEQSTGEIRLTYTDTAVYADGTTADIAGPGLTLPDAIDFANKALLSAVEPIPVEINIYKDQNGLLAKVVKLDASGTPTVTDKTAVGKNISFGDRMADVWNEYEPLWIAVIAGFSVAIGMAILLKWYRGELRLRPVSQA